MARVSGYVLRLQAYRRTVFLECIDKEEVFGEPVDDFDHSRSLPLICFILDRQKITHIALGHRGIRSGTGLRRLNLDRSEQLTVPIPVSRILKLVPNRIRAPIQKRFAYEGLLTEKGFEAVAEAIRQIAPQSSSILDRYSLERTARIGRLSPEARKGLAYQKQAVVTALAIAGIDRESVQEWTPAEATPISFLEGLPSVRLREDTMVVNDLMKLPGFNFINSLSYGAAVFESETERLTVIIANRLPLEEQTGTDLIYYNETFQSFVMVQYKAMERDSDGEAEFRLPNTQLATEIDRMNDLLLQLKKYTPNTSSDGFRLTENPFFIKLCPRIIFNPDDVGLVPGMYLPLDYWKLLEVDPAIDGPRGGCRVTYENTGRYFNNSAFVSLVARAWVGTTPAQSAILGKAIRGTLEEGKAIALAVKSEHQSPTSDDVQIP